MFLPFTESYLCTVGQAQLIEYLSLSKTICLYLSVTWGIYRTYRDLRRRSTSMVEYKDQTYRKLKEELMRAQGELQLKDQECGKLERVRDQMEQELEELTASLFEVSQLI